MPDPQTILIWVIAVPAAIALVATLVSHVPFKRGGQTQPWGPALAVAAAFAATFIALRGAPRSFPPTDANWWLVYLGAAAALVGVIAAITSKRGRWLVPLASVLLIAATVWLLSRSQIPLIGWRQFVLRIAVIFAGFVAWWLLMDRLAARVKGSTVPLVLMLTAAVGALVLVNAHSTFLGQLAGSVASALGALKLVGLWFRNLSIARGGVLAVTVLMLGVILAGHHFADLSMTDLILLAAAPLAAWLGELPFMKHPRPRLALRLVAVLLVLLIPLVPALQGLRETMQEQTESYMY